MKKTNKGFTIVELVVVIAVVAVLAAVLIPTFTSIIKKANDSAYLQERQNQRIEDLAEKIDNQNYLTWDDFEGKIAEAIADAMPAGDHLTEEEVKTAIQSAIDEYSAAQANTRLTEEQVKKIVEKSLEGQVTMEQITALVNKAAAANPGVNVATVQSIVNQAIAGMSANPGLSAAQVSAMITSALQGQASSTEKTVAEAVAAALEQYSKNNPSLTAEQVAAIVDEALAAQTPAGPTHVLSVADKEAQDQEKVLRADVYDDNGINLASTHYCGSLGELADLGIISETNDGYVFNFKYVTIYLIGNVTDSFETMALLGEKNITIDLNGYTLYLEKGLTLFGGAHLTINDSGVDNGGVFSSQCISFFGGGKDGMFQIADSTMTINGGTFDAASTEDDMFKSGWSNDGSTIVINGGSFKAAAGKSIFYDYSNFSITINGGSFDNSANGSTIFNFTSEQKTVDVTKATISDPYAIYK